MHAGCGYDLGAFLLAFIQRPQRVRPGVGETFADTAKAAGSRIQPRCLLAPSAGAGHD